MQWRYGHAVGHPAVIFRNLGYSRFVSLSMQGLNVTIMPQNAFLIGSSIGFELKWLQM